MKRTEIEHLISRLARSQGSWSRTWVAMNEMKVNNPTLYDKFMSGLEQKDFKDMIDLILYFEN